MESRNISIAFFIGGIFFILISFLMGETKGGIFFIFPFIYGTGFFMLFGILFIFISMLLFIFSFPSLPEDEMSYTKKVEKKGGLFLIGPIPIIITNDKKLATIFILISIIFIFLFLAFFFIKI